MAETTTDALAPPARAEQGSEPRALDVLTEVLRSQRPELRAHCGDLTPEVDDEPDMDGELSVYIPDLDVTFRFYDDGSLIGATNASKETLDRIRVTTPDAIRHAREWRAALRRVRRDLEAGKGVRRVLDYIGSVLATTPAFPQPGRDAEREAFREALQRARDRAELAMTAGCADEILRPIDEAMATWRNEAPMVTACSVSTDAMPALSRLVEAALVKHNAEQAMEAVLDGTPGFEVAALPPAVRQELLGRLSSAVLAQFVPEGL